jgi:dTDP-glucose pyrophosphorylase
MMRVEEIFVTEDTTIRDALKIIDKSTKRIALVVDEDKHLLGTIVDGDIRRGLIRGVGIDALVGEVMFKEPMVCHASDSQEQILRIALSKKLYQIPIIDEEGMVVGLEELDDLLHTPTYNNKVVLMVGGLGTRLRPLTNTTPKPLLKVGNRPILETIIENFSKHGFREFILSVNYKSEMIEAYFGDGSKFGVKIEYIHEDKRLGTAGALSLMRDRLSDDFFVMNGDILTDINYERLLSYHQVSNSDATMCVREYEHQIPYGVVDIEDEAVVSIKEKPLLNFYVSAGIYMLSPSTLHYIPDDTFYDMPTLYEKLIEEKKNVNSFVLDEYWLDIGQVEEYERANSEFKNVFR